MAWFFFLKMMVVRGRGGGARAKFSLHVSTVTPACSLSQPNDDRHLAPLLHPSFPSWLATMGPTSWAGTSFLSDAISLHPTGPLSPA